ncbi:MAG: glycosyltransferase [Candidatus Cloacimonetes bacterium]|nr:glycosyltransferase [Candidatus Cloacimonadota bacterium]
MDIITILFLLLFIYYCYYLLIFYKGLKRRYLHASNEHPFVSVVVAARNEAENIIHLLTTLINQDYPQNMYEIIIADDRSVDRTVEIVKKFQQKFNNIKLINVDILPNIVSRKKNALSQAINESKGKIILTTDADCIVKTTWISGMNRYFGKNVGLVAGLSRPDISNWKQTNFVEKYEYLDTIALFSAAAGSIGQDKPFSCSGQNIAYTREAYNAVGGFKKIKKFISGDDVLLMQLIRNKGYKIRFAFSEATHNLTKSEKHPGKFLNQRIRWASNEKPQSELNPEFFIFLLDVFLLNLIIVMSLLFSFTHFFIFLIFKSIGDFFIIKKGIKRFNLKHNAIIYFPLWALIQPFYILITGIGGKLNLFRWNKNHK